MKKIKPEQSLMPAGGEAKYLQDLLEEIAAHSLHTVKKIILFGECLCYIKEHKGQYGEWGDWCDSNIPNVNRRTLQRWMACYQNRKLIEDSEVNTPTDAYKLIAKTGKTTKNDTVSQASVDNQPSTSSGSSSDSEQQAAEDCKNRDDEVGVGVVTHEPVDVNGTVIPEAVRRAWEDGLKAKDALNLLSQAKKAINALKKKNEQVFLGVDVNYQRMIVSIGDAYKAIQQFIPYAVCPECRKTRLNQCPVCKKRGYLSQDYWNNYLSIEAKQEAKRK